MKYVYIIINLLNFIIVYLVCENGFIGINCVIKC